MSQDFETTYEKLLENLSRISKHLSDPFVDFANKCNILPVKHIKEMEENSINEHTKQKQKIMRNEIKCFIFGETSAGKSSLINAILKQNYLPNKNGRTTNCFVEIKKSSNKETYFLVNGEERNIESLNNMISYTSKNHLPDGSRVELFCNSQVCPILEDNIVIIDTPGIDTDKEIDRLIEEYGRDADLIILVVDSTKAVNNTIQSFLRKSSTSFSKLRFILIYNFWDENNIDEDCDLENQNDRNALKNQLMKDADELFKEYIKYPTRLENERIFFISAKEQMRFNENKRYLKDNERWKYRHEEFERFLDKFKEEMNINENKRKYEYLEALCEVQMEVLEECKSVIGIIEEKIPRISLNYFAELNYFEEQIKITLDASSKLCYDRLITSLIRENKRNEKDVVRGSIQTISIQSMDKLIQTLLTEIKEKRDRIIKECINSILQLSYDTFATNLDREINKKRDVRVKESIESISKKTFDKIGQDLFEKMNERDNFIIKRITKSLSKQCYDNLIKDSIKEMNKRCDGSINNVLQSLLEQSFVKFKEDLTKEMYGKGNELIKDSLRALSEKSSDEFVKNLCDQINESDENIIESESKEIYNKMRNEIFDEVNKKNKKMLQNLFESITKNSFEKLNKYLIKEFNSNNKEVVEGLLKKSCEDFLHKLIESIQKDDLKDSNTIAQNGSYDVLIKDLFRIINNNYNFINKNLIEKIFNNSFDKFNKELITVEYDEAIKESVESILKQFFDKLTQDLLREINPDEFDHITYSNQATPDPFYTNLTQDLLSRMNKKVNEVFKIQIKVNSDPSYDCLLRHLFVVSNKNLKMTKEINESTKKQFCDKLVEDLSNQIITSKSEVIEEWKETTVKEFCESLKEDLLTAVDGKESHLIKVSIESVSQPFYDRMDKDLLKDFEKRSDKIISESVPLISQQSYTLIINKSFEAIDKQYGYVVKSLSKLAAKSYKTLTQELRRGINKNNDTEINKLIKSISQQSCDNFIIDSSRVLKGKCKERITDPLESVSKPFWDQLIENLLKEIDQICNGILNDSIMLILDQSHEKFRQNLLTELINKKGVTIKSSIESVLKKTQNNLTKDLFGAINIKVESLFRQNGMKETMKNVFSDYLNDLKENIKNIIKTNEREDQIFIIENFYFPYYLEPCFPNDDSSVIAKMNRLGNIRKWSLIGLLFTYGVLIGTSIIFPVALVVSGVVVLVASLSGASGGLGIAIRQKEKIIKEHWKIISDFILGSHSKFLRKLKQNMFEWFQSERKFNELNGIIENLKCIYQEVNETKTYFQIQ